MDIRFDVYFPQNIGTLYKDNEIDTLGREGKVNLDLSQVNSLIVTFKIGEASFTDTVAIKNIEDGLIQIPFKTDVIKQGNNSFEIIATMKNGDLKKSQTYTYFIEKSLVNENSLEAETNYPVLIQLLSDVQGVKDAEVARIANEQARQVLKDELLLLKSNLESLQGDLNSLDSTVIASENTRQSNEEARQTLNDSMSILKSNLESLQTDLNSLESSIETNESTRQNNESTRGITFTTKISEVTAKVTEVNNKIVEANTTIANVNIAKDNTVIATNNANTKITETEATRQSIIATTNNLVAQFNALAPANSTNAEVQLARTSATGTTYASLQERLLADNKQQNILYASVSGPYISTDSVDGYAENVIIEGNTYQNPSVLSDIRSTGTKLADGRFEIPLLSCGKNILGCKFAIGNSTTGNADITRFHANQAIKVIKNTDYYVTVPVGYNFMIVAVDKNNVFNNITISAGYLTSHKFNTGNNDYISIQGKKVDGTNIDLVHLNSQQYQMETGSVATTFESYKEDKLTILSDCQIEKVGTVVDRLYYNGENVIDKNIITKTLNISNINYNDIFPIDTGVVGKKRWVIYANNDVANIDVSQIGCLSNKIKSATASDTYLAKEGICLNNVSNRVILYLDRYSDGSADNKNMLINELFSEGLLIKYIASTPQKIILPDAQQVALRTFNNKTNISFLTEIEGTIKCDVPKSTSASVNSLTTKVDAIDKDLERVKKLEDATNSTVIDDGKGFVSMSDTSNGYLSDIKIEGRTLINRVKDFTYWTKMGNCVVSNNGTTLTINATDWDHGVSIDTDTVPKGKQRLVLDNINLATIEIKQLVDNKVLYSSNGRNYVDFELTSDTCLNIVIKNTAQTGIYVINSPMLLEYAVAQNQSSYFTGLKSVGQDVNRIVVSSVKADGNLFDENYRRGIYSATTGMFNPVTDYVANVNFINVTPNLNLQINDKLLSKYLVSYYDKSKNFINLSASGNTFVTPSNCYYINLRTATTVPIGETNLMTMVNKGIAPILYRPFETDKKEILFLDTSDSTWKKPVFRGIWSNGIMTVGDIAEKKSDGKYSYRKRMGEVVLNGSEAWSTQDKGNVLQGLLVYPNLANNVMSDKFKFSPLNDIEECIWIYDKDRIVLNINKSKLTTQDVAGFKAWLQSNPVTVVYELKNEQVYECTPIDVASYDSETNYYLESGVLSPRSTIKAQNFIGNIINTMKEKISLQENTNNFLMAMALDHEIRVSLIEGGM